MSLKRRFTAQYTNVTHFFQALELPGWMTGARMRVALLVVLVASSGAYVLRTGSSVALGYQIKGLETQIADLTAEQQKVEVEVATYRSMNSVQARLGDLKMVPVARINRMGATVSTVR